MPETPIEDQQATRVRQAIEHIAGKPLPQDWPQGALPAGTRVHITRDPNWDGPWAAEFTGAISTVGAPKPVQHAHATPGELEYFVTFDEPRYESSGEGPYHGAQIWDRYIQPE
ncbi:ferrous iron transport protein A [Phytomonospora endophytica]|uniref:Ferrous iron transport protein A n=1 Tax=Phytomonospora endophytica TaxID=714109 RepID=A0A841G1H5_9ACTN|nr:ferrous iron transport protein A [Phytomonospora endophytica]MBB6038519.1 hypothetical protein [Phytomonospora endophytica]GIG69342.1 hypothetical protein Pen01_56370 [Phytomonospora endophytica]